MQHESKPRKKALGYLGVFVAVLIVLTLLTNTLAHLSLAQVKTINPERNSLTRTLEASGFVSAGDEEDIRVAADITESGAYVEDILVEAGDDVKKGDVLVVLNLDKIRDSIEEQETAITKARLQNERSDMEAHEPSGDKLEKEKVEFDKMTEKEKRKKSLETAEEKIKTAKQAVKDAEKGLETAEATLVTAQGTLSEAKKALEKAKNNQIENAQQEYDKQLAEALKAHGAALEEVAKEKKTQEERQRKYDREHDDAVTAVNDAQFKLDTAIAEADARPTPTPDPANPASPPPTLEPVDLSSYVRLVDDAKKALTRLEEDYELELADMKKTMNKLEDTVKLREEEFNKLRNEGPKQSPATQEEAIKAAEADIKAAETGIKTAEEGIETAKQTIKDKEKGVEEAKAEKKDVEKNIENEEWLEEYNDRQRKLEKQKASAQEGLSDRQAGIDRQLRDMEMQEMNDKLTQLRESISSGGEILAPADGRITKIDATVGSPLGMTLGKYTQPSVGMNLVVRVSKDMSKYFLPGDKATVSFPDSSAKSVETLIKKMEPVEGEAGMVDVTMSIEGSDAQIGENAKFIANKETAVYDCVVPREVVNSDDRGDYVFVLREKSDGWGASQYVERVNVQITEQNASYAAIQGSVGQWDSLVRSSNKALDDGQGVQVMQ